MTVHKHKLEGGDDYYEVWGDVDKWNEIEITEVYIHGEDGKVDYRENLLDQTREHHELWKAHLYESYDGRAERIDFLGI